MIFLLQKLLIIQDLSCAGQVSLSSALPILGAAGYQPTVLPTALLSTHTGGFGENTFLDLSSELTKIINHWSTIPLTFSNVYLGYLGQSAISVILNQLKQVLTAESAILLDPVMGDHGKLYQGFNQDYPAQVCQLAKHAALLTPNLTEAELLLQRPLSSGTVTISYAQQLMVDLQKKFKHSAILITGVNLSQQKIAVLGSEGISREIWQLTTPKLPGNYFGTGDLFASAITAAVLKKVPLKKATQIAMNFVADNLKQCELVFPKIDSRLGLDYSDGLPLLLKQLNTF